MSIDKSDWMRWAASGAIVLLAHAGATAALINWPPPAEGEPAAALVIELAALPAAPETPEIKTPPDPVIKEMQPEPPPPEEVAEIPPPEEPPPPEPPPPPEAVAIEPPPPPEKKLPPPKPKAVATTAPKPQKRVAAVAVAPSQGMPTESLSNLRSSWHSRLSAQIQRNLRVPPAQSQQGVFVASIGFVVDRNGNVSGARVARGSGLASVDEAAVAAVRRAQPLPPPPPEMPGGPFDLVLPVRITLR